jgi:hypothetical protein
LANFCIKGESMVTILFVWTVVAGGGSSRHYMDWRALAEFSSRPACQKAIEELGLTPDKARCVSKQ